MIALSLAEIATLTGGALLAGDPGARVTGPVVIDSRRAAPGGLFAAIAGERADGHDFAAAAVAAGAAAVLAARPLPEGIPAIVVPDVTAALALLARAVASRLTAGHGLVIAGITGSSGKTSTKDLTAQVAERLGATVAPEESLNNELGVPLTVLRADERTRFLILEMAARGVGHIGALCDIAPPRIGAVLNVGRAHAGEFGSVENIAKAKGELIEALPRASAGGVAILNSDDPRVLAMAGRTDARVVTFSAAPLTRGSAGPAGYPVRPHAGAHRTPAADVRAAEITLDDLGRASFRLMMAGGMAPVTLRLHGAHHVPNALAAAAIAAELGMEVPAIADALSQASARSGKRMDVRERADGVLVINDAYNANPDSMRAGIQALAHIAGAGGHARRGIAVLGHMAELGDTEAGSHAEAGRLAAQAGVAILVAVGESARPVLDGARAQPGWGGAAVQVPDTTAAVDVLRNLLRPKDVVLVKASKSAGLWVVADGLLSEVDR
jgi:UDP-N-acetylmuramoyl-tripeptide--D-alanyl-D-alanine ligase